MNGIIPVAVVGGGPCGLLMALLLARSGVSVSVFERKPGISTHPKAMGLTSRTMEVFRQLGLQSAIEAASLPLEGRNLQIWCRSLTGEELGRIPIPDWPNPYSPANAVHCPQTETERVLWEALQQEPNATVHFNSEVVEVRQSLEGGELCLSDGTTFFFSWLVASDGAGSPLRHWLQIPTSGPGDLGHFLNVEFFADYGRHLHSRPALMYPTLWREGMETFVAVNGRDHWLMHHFLQPTERESDFPMERLEAIIREASGLPEIPVEVRGVSPWVMSPKLANEFRRGRVFLAGDAAARLSPAGGLGLNTGLQSVHNLAWKLAAVVRGEASDSLLDTYQEERNPLSLAILRSTNQNAGEVFAIVVEAMEDRWDEVRKLVANSRRAQSGMQLDLGFAYRSGAVLSGPSGESLDSPRENIYQPTATPGCRAPHLVIQREAGESSLLDLFGMGFVLIAGDQSSEWRAASPCCPVAVPGVDFHANDFGEVYGLSASGAVLVRPDGVIAARWEEAPEDPAAAVLAALHQISHPESQTIARA